MERQHDRLDSAATGMVMKTNGRMVHYEKAMRERAAREKKFLVTISIEGKHLKDDSCTVTPPYKYLEIWTFSSDQLKRE